MSGVNDANTVLLTGWVDSHETTPDTSGDMTSLTIEVRRVVLSRGEKFQSSDRIPCFFRGKEKWRERLETTEGAVMVTGQLVLQRGRLMVRILHLDTGASGDEEVLPSWSEHVFGLRDGNYSAAPAEEKAGP